MHVSLFYPDIYSFGYMPRSGIAGNTWRNCSESVAINVTQITPHRDSTSFLLGWFSWRTQTTTNVGEDVGKSNPYTLLVVMWVSISTVEISMEASQRIELPHDL
jgi:hypothetical protein